MIWKITQRILIVLSVLTLLVIAICVYDIDENYVASTTYTYTGTATRVNNVTGVMQGYEVNTKTWVDLK